MRASTEKEQRGKVRERAIVLLKGHRYFFNNSKRKKKKNKKHLDYAFSGRQKRKRR